MRDRNPSTAWPSTLRAPFARFACVMTMFALGAVGSGTFARGADDLEYNRDIRPILSKTCFACHGPDSAARKADLRLDQRDAAIDMGAIVPGEPDDSELIARILADDPEAVMPPPETKKTLTPAEKERLVRWIRGGAAFQAHWSFIPPRRPEPPKLKNSARVRNPIDNFILARVEAAGLTPAPEADRRALARRAALDLTGLPPTPEMVEDFVANSAPDAYEKLVDELLDSPHWGEHRGRYWLDYARYADTHGIHFDNFREMWSYREWVIDAFNHNMPYDRFTIENLAGDLLPSRTLAQQIGSGFNRCNMTTNEGGIINEEYLVLYTRDRTETTAQVWLGLTANCAVCHSHKFDPLSQREFYEMAAFFNNTTQQAKDGNIKNTPPIAVVPTEDDLPRWRTLQTLVAGAKQRVDARREAARPDFDAWLAEATSDLFASRVPRQGLHLHANLDEGPTASPEASPKEAADDSAGANIGVSLDGQSREVALAKTAEWQEGHVAAQAVRISKEGIAELADAGDFDADQPFSCATWIRLPANDVKGAIVARMDDRNGYRGWDFWVEGRRVGMHLAHHWSDDAIKVVSKERLPANRWVYVAVTYDGSKKASGVEVFIDGRPQKTNVRADSLKHSIRATVPLKIGQRHSSSPLSGAALQDLRIYDRSLDAGEVDALAKSTRYAALVAKAAEERTDAEKGELYEWWLSSLDPAYMAERKELDGLERERNAIDARGTIAHVMQEKSEPATAYVLFRGEYDQRREQVFPDTPEALPAFPEDFPRNRLGFARWLLLPEHPLTARVTVNRFWQEVFGTGLVATTGDFGVSGQLPSHPELLDWLAVDFRESGWDVKRFFKLILMSGTYRQSATASAEKLAADPENRLLARGPRFRMDGEMVRDYALAASGLLVRKLGGPSVKPYQPPGVWEAIAMNVSNTRSYRNDSGEGLYRRSMYTFWKRMAPPASMDIFNAPNREYCVVRRERTNTPLQALVTLNGEQFVEGARNLAQRALHEGGAGFAGRLRVIGLRLLARPFRSEEVRLIETSLRALHGFYKEHPEDAARLIAVGESTPDASIDPVELAAWTMLANQLMNLDEALNK